MTRITLNPTRRGVASRVTLAAIGGLGLAGALAGCATDAGSTDSSGSTGDSSSGTTSDAPYADGTYSATGSYVSPNGPETIDVTVTLESDVITDVEVVSNATNSNSVRYQGEFVDGIADEVVGVDIDELSVDKVGGSSLTSGGFNDAIEQIKAEASS